jgi:hypothetical protein
MRRLLYVAVLVSAVGVPVLSASALKEQAHSYQQGTVLAVDKKEITSPNECCYSATDAPLQTQYFAYDVSVKVNCGTYVGHYESAYDYLPSEFAANHKVEVRLAKHNMYLDVPGEREMKMAIVHRQLERGGPCGTGTASR